MKKIEDPEGTSNTEVESRKEKKDSSRYRVLETYSISNPLAQVKIVSSGEQIKYLVEETKLEPLEKEAHEKLASLLTKELVPPEDMDYDIVSYIISEAKRLALKYKRSLGKFEEKSW
ncbi:MAG: hypothetical protein ACETWE_00870, partial [Candidatus Bathyarchaeia archaeon]